MSILPLSESRIRDMLTIVFFAPSVVGVPSTMCALLRLPTSFCLLLPTSPAAGRQAARWLVLHTQDFRWLLYRSLAIALSRVL